MISFLLTISTGMSPFLLELKPTCSNLHWCLQWLSYQITIVWSWQKQPAMQSHAEFCCRVDCVPGCCSSFRTLLTLDSTQQVGAMAPHLFYSNCCLDRLSFCEKNPFTIFLFVHVFTPTEVWLCLDSVNFLSYSGWGSACLGLLWQQISGSL